MRRKILVIGFRVIATVFFLLSILLVIAVRLSEKGDIVDRNAGWIIVIFFIAAATLGWSIYISDVPQENIHKLKSTDELLNEIKKSNLAKLRNRNKQL